MRIAVLTSNQPRHVALLDALIEAGHDVVAVIEPKTWNPAGDSPVLQRYWAAVQQAELDVFGPRPFARLPVLACRPGEASALPESAQAQILAADRIVVFGSSYLRHGFATALIAHHGMHVITGDRVSGINYACRR